MQIFFPQWQGSGTGVSMKTGAETVVNYLNTHLTKLPLSDKALEKQSNINGHEALVHQLTNFRSTLESTQPKTLQTIGGDCGLEIIPVSYLASKYNNLGVIWFDAHADINLPEESPSCNFHGMPLRTLLGEGDTELKSLLFSTINASQIHYIGLRSIDESEQKYIVKEGIYAPSDFDTNDLIKTLQNKNITQLYIHFDVDCLDPKSYKSAYFNVNNGITTDKAQKIILELINNFDVVGTSILESVATTDEELTPIKPIIDLLFNV
ncbi:MAG: arginase family protein [Winogradskyella sp.]|uniref:arginase family protein n=1 Tax=Winogradskyella sp. TaxID=1883156 RepID=UPI000F3B0BE1|nr:arginase family protein [Winogradskyella sp.]RNC86950.1 MAG: arginase family protein [Winogradskyella sp.]